MTIRFLVLGRPEVDTGTGAVSIPASLSNTLFTALAMRPNTPVGAERLTDALWETRHAQPAADVGSAIADLRRVLPPPAESRLVSRGDRHLLIVEPDELDLDRFTLLFRQGRAALDAEDHHAAAYLLGLALAICRGPAGTGCQCHGWLRRRLAAIEDLRWSAAEGRLAALLALGRTAEAIAEAQTLFTGDLRRVPWWVSALATGAEPPPDGAEPMRPVRPWRRPPPRGGPRIFPRGGYGR